MKQVNTYRILFYTLIYKYFVSYIFFILFLILGNRYCCLVTFAESKNIFHFLVFWISFYMFSYLSLIIVLVNALLILYNIYIFYRSNKNKLEIKYLDEIKKINMFEIITIILTIIFFIIILYTPIFRILNLDFYTFIFITAFPCGILPISILEILFYFEKKKKNLLKVGSSFSNGEAPHT